MKRTALECDWQFDESKKYQVLQHCRGTNSSKPFVTSGFSAGIATSGEAIGREGNKALSCDDELLSFNCWCFAFVFYHCWWTPLLNGVILFVGRLFSWMFHPFNALPVDRMGGRERDLMEAESRNMRELAARRRVQPAAMFLVTSASMYSYSQMGVSKNRGKHPKMDGENNGKPY